MHRTSPLRYLAPVVALAVFPILFTAPSAEAQIDRGRVSVAPPSNADRTQARVEAVAADIDALQEALAMLLSELEEIGDDRPERPGPGASDKAVAAWEKELASWKARMESLRGKIDGLEAKLQKLESELESLRAAATAPREKDASEDRRLAEVRDRLGRLDADLTRVSDELEEAKRSLAASEREASLTRPGLPLPE